LILTLMLMVIRLMNYWQHVLNKLSNHRLDSIHALPWWFNSCPITIKFVSDLRQVCGFLRVLQFPPPASISDW
jgi:hypothetical protein